MKLLHKGAEADLYLTKWKKNKSAIAKIRKKKPYRNSVLDSKIRRQRTMREAKMISQVKQYGITSPLLYFVDLQNSKIIMQKLQGQLIRDLQDENLIRICKKVGKIVATLHKNEVMHGDLTTSNFILVNHNKEDDYTHRNRAHNKKASINIDKVAIIDFGLSQKTNRTEDYAVDLRLFKGILYSAHVRIMESGWKRFISGYRTESDSSFTDKVLKQLSYIESRGRYATVV